jgi:hypothetical protein
LRKAQIALGLESLARSRAAGVVVLPSGSLILALRVAGNASIATELTISLKP